MTELIIEKHRARGGPVKRGHEYSKGRSVEIPDRKRRDLDQFVTVTRVKRDGIH